MSRSGHPTCALLANLEVVDNQHLGEDRQLAQPGSGLTERIQRFVEEAGVREQHREVAESVRQEHEQLREDAETARATAEAARAGAEASRDETMTAVHVIAETLRDSLKHMQAVEELRRALRDTRDRGALDAN